MVIVVLFFKKKSKDKANIDSDVIGQSSSENFEYDSNLGAGEDTPADAVDIAQDIDAQDLCEPSVDFDDSSNASDSSLGKPPISSEEIESLLEEPTSFFDTAAQSKVSTSSSGYRLSSKKEIKLTNIDVRSSCGFDFSGVVEGHQTRAENERTGSSHVVYASGANFSKIQNDLKLMQPMFQTLSSATGKALYGVEFPDCTDMFSLLRPFGEKRGGRSHGMQGIVILTIREQDDAGCNLKYPVMMKAACATRRVVSAAADSGSAAVRAQMDSLVLDIAYLPSGRADIGRLVRWEGRKGYLCEFRWSGVEQKYVPMKVNTASTPGNWKPTS